MTDGIERTAILSDDGVHRYLLTRRWGPGDVITFIMLNPSFADDTVDDRTVSKVMKHARVWGYGGLDVLNLYAFRSPHPEDLWTAPDPVGPENDAYLRAAGETGGMIVGAWGDDAKPERVAEVLAHPGLDKLHCLVQNKSGHPRHPLYARMPAAPIPWPVV